MTSISIRRCIVNGRETSIHIEDHLITEIGKSREADKIINARKKLALPSFVNTHTHSAMCLLRGYADDMVLDKWLQNKIWPMEKKMKPEHIYWGARLACLEMIKTGTTAFNDMYFHMEQVAKAVGDASVRGVLGYGFVDMFKDDVREKEIKATENFVKHVKNINSPNIKATVAPHAVYTVSDEGWKWCTDYAKENELLIHTHIAETEKEMQDCLEQRGDSPVCHLDKLGVLGPNVISAHSVWLDHEEVEIFAQKGVKVSNCPASNMKLGVGRAMPYLDMRKAHIEPTLGTDGAASNNSMDMFEQMKIASLLQKYKGNPIVLPHREALQMASRWGANALELPIGEIAVGREADIILLDTQATGMAPMHNVGSNLVYSCNGSAVETTICRGKILMLEHEIESEDIVLKKVERVVEELTKPKFD